MNLNALLSKVSTKVAVQVLGGQAHHWVNQFNEADFEGSYGGYTAMKLLMDQVRASSGAQLLGLSFPMPIYPLDHVLQSFHGEPTGVRNEANSNDKGITVCTTTEFHINKTIYEEQQGGQEINCDRLDQIYSEMCQPFRDRNLESVDRFQSDLHNPSYVKKSYRMAWKDQVAEFAMARSSRAF